MPPNKVESFAMFRSGPNDVCGGARLTNDSIITMQYHTHDAISVSSSEGTMSCFQSLWEALSPRSLMAPPFIPMAPSLLLWHHHLALPDGGPDGSVVTCQAVPASGSPEAGLHLPPPLFLPPSASLPPSLPPPLSLPPSLRLCLSLPPPLLPRRPPPVRSSAVTSSLTRALVGSFYNAIWWGGYF